MGAYGAATAVVSCRSADEAAAVVSCRIQMEHQQQWRAAGEAASAVVSCEWSCSGDELQGAAAMDCRRDLR